MKTPALLEYVRPIAAAGQDLHLLPLYAQANLDPLQALRIQGGRAEHERNSLVGRAQPPPEYRRIWPEVPTSVGICHLSQCSFVLEECQTPEQSSFHKYTTCSVFLALRNMLYLCICVFVFVYLSMRHLVISVLISWDQELSENVWFVWPKTSNCGDLTDAGWTYG